MPIEMKLTATKRTDLGKGASRRLRRARKVPAVLYGGHKDAIALTLEAQQVLRLMDEEAFYSQIIAVEVDGKAEQAVVKDIQRHPFKPLVSHVDLQRVVADEVLRSRIPLHFTGQEELIKSTGGVFLHELNEVEIECLPNDLPQHIEVDCSGLQVGESLHLADLKLPAGVTIPALAQGPDHNVAVVTLTPPRVSEEAAAEEGAAEAGEETE